MGTAPRPFVFVLMPFDESFDDVYKVGVKPACEAAGGYCERIDDQIFDESILLRIYNQISKADVLVADMSGRNPNVFYETGYAHALGKRVVLLTHNAADIPFDLKHYPHIVYGARVHVVREELERRLRWFFQHPNDQAPRELDSLVVAINGTVLGSGDEEVTVTAGRHPVHSEKLDATVDLHNPLNVPVDLGDLQIGVVLPRSSFRIVTADSVMLPEEGRPFMLLHSGVPRIMPGGWASFPIDAWLVSPIRSEIISAEVRLFSEFGSRRLPFVIRLTAQAS